MQKIQITVKGMHCSSCEDLIKMALEDIGITKTHVDHKKGIVSVEFDPSKASLSDIKGAIEKEGYDPL